MEKFLSIPVEEKISSLLNYPEDKTTNLLLLLDLETLNNLLSHIPKNKSKLIAMTESVIREKTSGNKPM